MISKFSEGTIKRFRIVAFLEGCSFLLLGFTMILKYKYEMPQPNYIVGMAHGFLFIVYIILLAHLYFTRAMNFIQAVWSFIASLLPFGTFIADVKIFRKLLPS
jgi:integral membrane protein